MAPTQLGRGGFPRPIAWIIEWAGKNPSLQCGRIIFSMPLGEKRSLFGAPARILRKIPPEGGITTVHYENRPARMRSCPRMVPPHRGRLQRDVRRLVCQPCAAYALQPFDVRNGEFPPSLDACDAYLTTGSRWLTTMLTGFTHWKNFTRRIHEAKKPFVGVCFGHQMMAEALGGASRELKRAGAARAASRSSGENWWMRPEQSRCALQYMHQDQVERLPDDGVVIGDSDHCPVAMFRVGDSMLGIQAHPRISESLQRGAATRSR